MPNKHFEECAEPLWCEDCQHFTHTDMGGEGECDLDGCPTWYAHQICDGFKPKSGED